MVSATSEKRESPPFVVAPAPPGTRFVEIRRFETLDSTNRYLIDQAVAGGPEGLVAVASYQSAGRGRLGRSWLAPPGTNLLASVLFRPALDPDDLHLLSIVVALATADACREVAGFDPQLKWPNDLYLGGRKLAGVLAESVPADAEHRAVVVGLGLNVRWPPPDSEPHEMPVPGELESIATSLWRETDSSGPSSGTSSRTSSGTSSGSAPRLEPQIILELLLGSLEHRLGDLDHPDGRRRQAAEYRRRCGTLGRRVSVTLGEEIVEGMAVDVTEAGHLVVDAGEGFRTITAGDVVHVD